jgi:hypothetical protein
MPLIAYSKRLNCFLLAAMSYELKIGIYTAGLSGFEKPVLSKGS